jgi:DNA-binding transcriptional MerR regulator
VSYTTAQAARLSGCSVAQLRYWARTGLVVASHDGRYGFRDLVALRIVRSLLDAGLPSVRARVAVEALRAAGDDDLARLRLVTDGRNVWSCRDDGQIIDALGHGQLALFVAVDRVTADLDAEVRAFAAERAAFVDELTRSPGARVSSDGADRGAGPAGGSTTVRPA